MEVATVVFCHGFGEHISRYGYEFDKFASAGIEVYGFDLRGYGRTGEMSGRLGVTELTAICSDITDALKKQHKGVPQFLMGHSMGGLITLHYLTTYTSECSNLAGAIVRSPLLENAPESRQSYFLTYFGRLASKLIPSFQHEIKLKDEYMSHDPDEVAKYRADLHIHGIGSLGFLNDLYESMERLRGNKPYTKGKEASEKVKLPILMAHGNGDKVTCFKTSKEFFDKVPSTDKTFQEWDTLYHELHNEFEKDNVIQVYIKWILERAKGKK